MYILRVEQQAPNFEDWKKAFDSDPINREKSGVRRHQVTRQVGNPNYVTIDMEFDTVKEAESTRNALQDVWKRLGGSIVQNPQVRISEVVETEEYQPAAHMVR
jgi:hypothetical protein